MSNELTTFSPSNFEELDFFAGRLAASQMVPKLYQGKPDDVFAAVIMGRELGISPMQALQGIAVINGRPSVWGDLLKAICMRHPEYVDCEESYFGEGENLTARCVVKRKGRADTVEEFAVKDARAAGLLGKDGPWKTYLKRMLKMRARAFALRDAFTDALKGIASAEESEDIERQAQTYTATVEPEAPAKPEPEAAQAEKPAYPDDRFTAQLPKIRASIKGGQEPQVIIDSLGKKYTLSPGQIGIIKAIPDDLAIEASYEQKSEGGEGE